MTHDLFLLAAFKILKSIPAAAAMAGGGGRDGSCSKRIKRLACFLCAAFGRGWPPREVTNSGMPRVRTSLVLMNSFSRHSCLPPLKPPL